MLEFCLKMYQPPGFLRRGLHKWIVYGSVFMSLGSVERTCQTDVGVMLAVLCRRSLSSNRCEV